MDVEKGLEVFWNRLVEGDRVSAMVSAMLQAQHAVIIRADSAAGISH